MSLPEPIQGLDEIADRYDVVLSDVWGVIHNGRERFAPACRALSAFAEQRGPVILISNAPRPAADVVPQLDDLGVPRAAWSTLITSGDATRALLADRAPGPVWAIGPDRDAALYAGLGLELTGPEDAALICVTGPYDDETETAEDYRDRFEAILPRRLPLLCANPDIVVQRGDRLIPCAGALARLYADLGGEVRMAGKPHAPIYDLCIAEAEARLGRPVDRRRVLCIGDGIPTDILGANGQDLDVLFVAGGIHGAELLGPQGLDMAATQGLLAQAGAGAQWASGALDWRAPFPGDGTRR
ncbi:TIGR01459 family HAD-type hydrolase [Phenylobacterium sp.]|jgi:HAD superfamily hydrolase (TIGR01459 family)|uniref:TIGR01459 family HAD-type hydrolase n=1 Tax=Phenylobacterium sp. TaxID=1871053 RepID=UPI0037C4FA06